MLSFEEKKQLMNRFPSIELSYEPILHTKVYGNVFMVLPKGQKMIAWFTYWKNKNICFFMKVNEKGQFVNSLNDIQVFPVSFSNEVALGTILYGTFFDFKGRKHFSCENILYYKGKCLEHNNFETKIKHIGHLFSNNDIKQKFYTKRCVVFGMSVIKLNYTQANECVNTLPYGAYGIQVFQTNNHHPQNKKESLGIFLIKNQRLNLEGFFKVKATLHSDIYNLYCYNSNHQDTPYSTAHISTYKNSVMMNSLFRNIKENLNLDLLEESDDEEEFQNISENKFVNLDKTYIMKCIFNKRVKKWEPVSIIKEPHVKLITYKEAKMIDSC